MRQGGELCGGRFATPGPAAAASAQTHGAIALALLVSAVSHVVFVAGTQGWPSLGLRRCVERVPLAFALSGAAAVTAGLFVALRVLWLCEGCEGFAGRDLRGQLSLSIAALLVACGTLESLHAVAIHTDRAVVAGRGATPRSRCAAAVRPLRSGWTHLVWCADLVLIGMMFVAHPQLTGSGSRRHVLAGAVLVLGAHLLAADKVQGRPTTRTALAGGCFGSAALALSSVQEPTVSAPAGHAVGVDASCYPGGRALALVGLGAAVCSVGSVGWALAAGDGRCAREAEARGSCRPGRRRGERYQLVAQTAPEEGLGAASCEARRDDPG